MIPHTNLEELADAAWYPEQTLDVCPGEAVGMSTVLGFVGTDGIVLATDSRETNTTEGGVALTHKDDTQKIHQLTPYIGLATHGHAVSYSSQLLDLFNRHGLPQLAKEKGDIDSFSNGFAIFIRDQYDAWVRNVPAGFLERPFYRMQFVLVGHTPEGAPKIIHLDSSPSGPRLAPRLANPYYTGEIESVAMYWCSKLENQLHSGMPVEALKRLAVFIINETAKIHDRVGGPVQLAIVTQQQGFFKVPAEETNEIEKLSRRIADERRVLRMLGA